MTSLTSDICIIGAGSGGLSVAAAASQMGAKVVLIEEDKMGGDCLNYGCVPSKALLAAAKASANIEKAKSFGIHCSHKTVNFDEVKQHIKQVIATIAPNDSIERFESLGVKVIATTAKFINKKQLVAGDYTITAKYYIIATGSTAFIPDIKGLNKVAYLTNETIFDIPELPKHLVIVGGGAIGCEMAQAFRRLGSEVTLLEKFNILPKDDPELVDLLKQRLLSEGINIFEQANIAEVQPINQQSIAILIEQSGQKSTLKASHLLIATGRKPRLSQLELEKADIQYNKKGIMVNRRLKTSNKRCFAMGDVIGEYQFTHTANYHAGIIIRNILFKLPSKVSYKAMPWVSYTDPEIAQIGLTETQIKDLALPYRIFRSSFKDNDRAQTEQQTTGLIKIILDTKGHVLGASIVGHSAGELILPWSMMIANKLKMKAMANAIVPYPTLSEVNKAVVGEYFKPWLFSNKIKCIVRFIMRLPFN